ncbi:MAG TPA: glycoside hydrolase family 16 protein [Candidatus Limnocylindrales bacterium]|nr:glycoside hydrolase family 16 protein [Candidatus Limnocylindrales bacterium]
MIFGKVALIAAAVLTLGMMAVLGAVTATGSEASARMHEPRWTLTWSDEFNGPDGARPDASKWEFDIGGKGWGNQELETYTDRAENSFLRGGNLVIEARKEKFTGADGVTREYTSARLKTLGLFAQAYGKFEARIKIPRGQGMWPAFWMMGDNIEKVEWPTCGEIDVMENIGREPSVNHGSMHGPGYSGAEGRTAAYTLAGGAAMADDFHVYGIEWEPGVVRFYVDGHLYETVTPASLPAGKKWVFDHPFFILLNVAVGGDWPGAPDAGTNFPQEMLVDWVRVYRAEE